MSVYEPLETLLLQIDVGAREVCQRLLVELREGFASARGSSHNHQTWDGGYLDHVTEVLNLAVLLYPVLDGKRKLPFTLSDALLVLFLHDIEKPWRQASGWKWTKKENHAFRVKLVEERGLHLTEDQWNGLTYVEGEGDAYSPLRRVMGPLATFCHLCDVTSARIWPDEPRASGGWGSEVAAARAYVAREGNKNALVLLDGTRVELAEETDVTASKAQWADAVWLVETLLKS